MEGRLVKQMVKVAERLEESPPERVGKEQRHFLDAVREAPQVFQRHHNL